MSEEVKEQPKLSMKVLDAKMGALAERVKTTELFVNTLGAIAERLQTIDEFSADLMDIREEVDALKDTQTAEDGSQGLDERIAAIEAKLEALGAAGLIQPEQIDVPALAAAIANIYGDRLRA